MRSCADLGSRRSGLLETASIHATSVRSMLFNAEPLLLMYLTTSSIRPDRKRKNIKAQQKSSPMRCSSTPSGARSFRATRILTYALTLLIIVGTPPRLASLGFRATSPSICSRNLGYRFSCRFAGVRMAYCFSRKCLDPSVIRLRICMVLAELGFSSR